MPSCNLYLSDSDYKYLEKFKKNGGNPSALFAKSLREEDIKQDKNAGEMNKIIIRIGTAVHDHVEGDFENLKSHYFYGKHLATGRLGQNVTDFNELEVKQDLYITRKGNYLLYEETHILGPERTEYSQRTFEKDKPITMSRMAPEIMDALDAGDDTGTFLDV
jgi:hypothetical protein